MSTSPRQSDLLANLARELEIAGQRCRHQIADDGTRIVGGKREVEWRARCSQIDRPAAGQRAWTGARRKAGDVYFVTIGHSTSLYGVDAHTARKILNFAAGEFCAAIDPRRRHAARNSRVNREHAAHLPPIGRHKWIEHRHIRRAAGLQFQWPRCVQGHFSLEPKLRGFPHRKPGIHRGALALQHRMKIEIRGCHGSRRIMLDAQTAAFQRNRALRLLERTAQLCSGRNSALGGESWQPCLQRAGLHVV